MKPNLFIVGAPKAGTTFLYEKLKSHPELFFPKIKELNYFSFDELMSLSYYKDYKIKDVKKYLNFYKKNTSQKYLIDPSVSYFSFSNVPNKIHDFNPNSKIVIILRNPIKRAFSHHQMDVRMGYSKLDIKSYISLGKKDPHFIQYIQNSLYFENISAFLKVFKRENICILMLEEIELDINKLFSFLEISNDATQQEFGERVNENKVATNFISRYMQKNRDVVSILKMFVPKKTSDYFKQFFYKKGIAKKMDKETYNLLYSCFKNDIENLSSLLNLDLISLWNIKKQ